MDNFPQLVALELRRRKNKSIKAIHHNADSNDLSVFTMKHSPETPSSFNYPIPEDATIESVAIDIALTADTLMGEPLEGV